LDFMGRFFPVLRLRASPEEEVLGIDDVEIGEFAVSLIGPEFDQSTTNIALVRLCGIIKRCQACRGL